MPKIRKPPGSTPSRPSDSQRSLHPPVSPRETDHLTRSRRPPPNAAPSTPVPDIRAQALSTRESVLYDLIRDQPNNILTLCNIERIIIDDKSHTLSLNDRKLFFSLLLDELGPTILNTRTEDGRSLGHVLITSACITTDEKTRLIPFLAERGTRFDHTDAKGLSPLDIARTLVAKTPELLGALEAVSTPSSSPGVRRQRVPLPDQQDLANLPPARVTPPEAEAPLTGTAAAIFADSHKDPRFATRLIEERFFSTAGGGLKDPSTADRRALLNKVLLQHRTGALQVQDAPKLLTTIIKSPNLSPEDKRAFATLVCHSALEWNQLDRKGFTPLEHAIYSPTPNDALIAILLKAGATLSRAAQLGVASHLIGVGGSLAPESSGSDPIPLELSLNLEASKVTLDPAFYNVLQKETASSLPKMRHALNSTSSAWQDTGNFAPFLKQLNPSSSSSGAARKTGPHILQTCWNEPAGHAVGFVLNKERGEHFLYACNTGNDKFPGRSVVKYQITNPERAHQFFLRASTDENHVRKFFTAPPKTFGLKLCKDFEQIPVSIDKSAQKRKDCPMAARKAALLAALWSTSRDTRVPAQTVRKQYKAITSKLKVEGVRQVIALNNKEMLGKTLLKLLSKFDRPFAPPLALEVANTLLAFPPTPTGSPKPDSKAYRKRILDALNAANASLTLPIPGTHSTPLEYARNKGRTKAVEILEKLEAERSP